MKTAYNERDYTFGQEMLKLRTAIGLTQGRLADYLGISGRAVRGWEAGVTYPKAGHLKALIALAVQQQAFTVGHESEEIRVFWKVARPKILLDEDWLSALLAQRNSPQEREAEIVQMSDTRQEIGTVPVFLHRTDPASSARSVPRSNLLPLLTPVPPVEGSPVTARPQRLEAETIGTPVPTGEMGTVQGEGAVQGTIEALGAEPNPQGEKTRGRRKRLLALVLLLVILTITGSTGTFFFQARLGATGQVNKTATVQAYPGYLTGNGTLAFFDPLSREAGSEWSSYSYESTGELCQFTRGAYHVSQPPNGYMATCSTRRAFSNFAFEVLSTITQGDCGGVFFRNDSNMRFYKFTICQDSAYGVSKYSSDTSRITLKAGKSSAIRIGLGKPNKIAVVASSSTMTFYVNEQQIDQVQDSSYTLGNIALTANPNYSNGGHATDVAYSNARLWTL